MPGGGHTLLYRAGSDSRIDRWNIALLKRIILKSTTPATLEIYYHEPTKLLDWADPQNGVRYIKLRSSESFPLAERIQTAVTDTVILIDSSLLARAQDIWNLMGHAERHAVVILDVSRAQRAPGESYFAFIWRSAALALKNYLYARRASGGAFAIHKKLAGSENGTKPLSFNEKKTYADYLSTIYPARAQFIAGRSYQVAPSAQKQLLATGAATVEALRTWRFQKKLPDWFSGRFLLFHVAQLAVYYGALVAFVSPKASLVVFAFAAVITPQYLFARLPWLRPHRALPQIGARFLLYFTG